MLRFEPTRTAALERLNDFLPKAGRDYAAKRNYDLPGHPHVSALSPYIRHRAMTEAEVLEATLARFAPSTAEKFIQEVYWRTYWKGWLELRPEVWDRYQHELDETVAILDNDRSLRRAWKDACDGETGIDCFDYWANQLTDTGYMHNHARMWFASIWIFTLRLPWVLGADFFLRHLLDGDPASNTLGWRWVGGIQTRGRVYAAKADNITRYTEGRFKPQGLERDPQPLNDAPFDPPQAVPTTDPAATGKRTAVLLHWEDLSPTTLMRREHEHVVVLKPFGQGTPFDVSERVLSFRTQLTEDAAKRYGAANAPLLLSSDLAPWAERHRIEQFVTAYAPVGPIATELAQAERELSKRDVTLKRQVRAFDSGAWPFATKGFFKFKEKIPTLLKAHQSQSAA
ncbi:MAG: DNA photolyase [Rhodobacteraceae bacterium]|nr:DNA photolyase [Paracoccaceae bacterium]